MIHILRERAEDDRQTEDVNQLNDIMNIQKEIVHSSSGVLNDTRFQNILKCIHQVCKTKFFNLLIIDYIFQNVHLLEMR